MNKSKHYSNKYNSNVSGIKVHVIVDKRKVTKIKLSGYPIDAKTSTRIDGINITTHTVSSERDLESAIKYLCGRIMAKYNAAYPNNSPKLKTGDGIYSKLFSENEEIIMRIPAWGENTKKKYKSYIVRNILPLMDEKGYELTHTDMEKISETLIKKAALSKHSYGDETFSSGNRSSLCAFNQIYPKFRELDSSLPDVCFPQNYGKKSNIFPEQCKELPGDLRVLLANILLLLSESPCFLGCAGMLFGNMRPSESAAMMMNNIQISDDRTYATYSIFTQEKDRMATPILKTDAAYRTIVFPKIMVDMYLKKYDYLLSCGYTDAQIKTMPCSCYKDDVFSMATGIEVSTFSKEILLLSGLNKEFLISAKILRENDPFIKLKDKKDGIEAYILRRDWATRMSNVCGLTATEIDYLMGHKNKKVCSGDYITPESQKNLARKMERYVFSPYHTTNPIYNPITVTHGSDFELMLNNGYAIVSDCAENEILQIKIDIECSERCDEIQLFSDCDNTPMIKVINIADKVETRSFRQIIAPIHNIEYFNKLENDAIKKINNCKGAKIEE